MQMTMRWFGPEEDKISLEHIRQVPGVEGVVGALYDVAVGEVWPVDKIERLVGQAHAAGLKMEVIESVNIHDDIRPSATLPALALKSSAITSCRFSTG